MRHKMCILVPVYNSVKWINKSLSSILTQNYDNFCAYVVDDGSDDGTSDVIHAFQKAYPEKCIVLRKEHEGSALQSLVEATQLSSVGGGDNDVLVTVDGDDWLSDVEVLSFLDDVYQDDEIWLTYGQYSPLSGSYQNYCQPLSDTTTYRKEKWVTSHLRTYKRHLWNKLRDTDLRDSRGLYYKTAGDLAIMYPLVEMCGMKHIKFIQRVMYIYNDLNPMNDMKKDASHQLRIANEIRGKHIYKELER